VAEDLFTTHIVEVVQACIKHHQTANTIANELLNCAISEERLRRRAAGDHSEPDVHGTVYRTLRMGIEAVVAEVAVAARRTALQDPPLLTLLEASEQEVA